MTNKTLSTYLSLCTEYYDLDKPQAPSDALAFYREYAKTAKGSILEPMCGTGHFLIPILEAGYEIHGFDASPFMLDALHKKCVAKRLKPKVWQGVIQEVALKETYALIFIPSGSLGLIIDLREVKLCLKKFWEQLKKGGKLIFEVETLKAIPQKVGVWKGTVRQKANGQQILMSKLSLPLVDNVDTTMCRYELVEGHKVLKAEMEKFQVRLYDLKYMDGLLKEVGFKQIKCLKAFDYNKVSGIEDEVVVYECTK